MKEEMKEAIEVVSPVSGEVFPLSEVEDPVFSSGLMGQGVAIRPKAGNLYAPAAGEVTILFETGHAYGLRLDSGVELLFHLGVEMIDVTGAYFTSFVEQGERVEADQLLCHFDQEEIEKAGFEVVVMVIVTNSSEYDFVRPHRYGLLRKGDPLLKVSGASEKIS